MNVHTVGVLHPGAMGSTVARALYVSGHQVVWVAEGRSEATRDRAQREGLHELPDLKGLVTDASIIVSICPPHGSKQLVDEVLSVGYRGIYVDANAITPATSAQQAARIADGGGHYVDGSIIGPPADQRGTTRLYLSGERAREVASLFGAGYLQVLTLDGDAFAASALKMAYAAYTKGSAALLLAVRAAASALNVEEDLEAEWELSIPDLPERANRLLQFAGRKAWRFEGEMLFIAETLDAVGLPDGFHRAAAEIYRRLAGQVDATFPVNPESTLADLVGAGANPELSR